jgi:two-component system sensor histidine kinase FlrB
MLLFVKGEVQLINRLSVSKIFELLQEATSGLAPEKRALIQWHIEAKEAHIQCQADALISAFMNVINNAIEANGESSKSITVSSFPKGDQVELVFKDQGPGMTADEIKKIQEPFFTTKSYGTGLGIPVLIATVTAHKGSLNIVSHPGAGTEFRVSLPVFLER